MPQTLQVDTLRWWYTSILFCRQYLRTSVKIQLRPSIPLHLPEPQPPDNQSWQDERLKTISNLNITIYDRNINQDHALEYLGITISENLSWNEYIENLMSKINQKLGILRRVKSLLPVNARLIFYTATILPLFDYACRHLGWQEQHWTYERFTDFGK
jgi:hypothetical protein